MVKLSYGENLVVFVNLTLFIKNPNETLIIKTKQETNKNKLLSSRKIKTA